MILNLAVQTRDLGKKSELKNLRNRGNIPAIIYSEGQPGITISVPANEFLKLYKQSIGKIALFNLKLGEHEYQTVVKARQLHPVSRAFVHVDFLELHKDKEINLSVPFKFFGTPASLKEGGTLEVTMRDLKVSCLPKFIPDDIPLSVEHIQIGETIYVKDLQLPNIIVKEPGNIPIVSVHAKSTKEEPKLPEAAPASKPTPAAKSAPSKK